MTALQFGDERYTENNIDLTIEPGLEPLSLARDQQSQLIELQQHIVLENYLGLILGEYGDTNRILSYHTIQKALKARENIKKAYEENNKLTGNTQQIPDNKVFHVPDLSVGSSIMTTEQARHDLWSGLLDADGIFIYNYFYRNSAPQVWEVYREGFTLIKSGGLRNYLVNGQKSTPKVTISKGMKIIPGNDYINTGGERFQRKWFELPDYSSINARLFRIGNIGFLIVSHSYNQQAEFSINLEAPVSNVEVVVGETNSLVKTRTGINDAFSGIDARVYKITFT